jgi:protoporphyrinogen oxidase
MGVPIVILGAGPAGVGLAFQLARRGAFDVTAVERNDVVGGNAGSFAIDGLRVDYGSHRLHPSCPPDVMRDIRSMLDGDLLDRPRHGRILLSGRWVHFPLKPFDLVRSLPPSFAAGVVRDTVLKPKANGHPDTFASVLERGLGSTICREFYFPYARKIWGVEPSELDAEQARRRVSAGSLGKMVRKVLNAVPGLKPAGGGRFFYPKRGYGQISEAYAAAAQRAGARLLLGTAVTALHLEGDRIAGVTAGSFVPARYVFSSVPLTLLPKIAVPAAPPEALAAAASLRYRGMILIYLVVEAERFTEFDAHYFPGDDVRITRLSEPKNYGLAVSPGRTVLCAELPCSPADAVWDMSDEQLGDLVRDALARAGVPLTAPVSRVVTRRLPQAYPIYTEGYKRAFDTLDRWAGGIAGLVTFGRQGLFAHDNTHHALAMAYAASRCLSDDGVLDERQWADYRRQFESHVVED